MKTFYVLLLVAIPGLALTSDRSPYVGEELRRVSSLSENEIASLRRGDGMGFAKLAELNHFPGPKHVLAIAEQLDLSDTQIESSRRLYQEMRAQAMSLGEELVAAEAILDQAFEDSSVTEQSLEESLLNIAEIRGRLRYVHLKAHLRQKEVLSADQVARYDAIRGYHGDAKDPGTQHQGHH